MMRKDVNERYTISQVLAHPWLQNIEVRNRDKPSRKNKRIDLFVYLLDFCYS